MGYKSLRHCAEDLERTHQLIRIEEEVDPHLEMAAIHRRVYRAGGPALLFERVKGSPFEAISNIYGTIDRTEYLFRKELPGVKKVIALKADPTRVLKSPSKYLSAPLTAWGGLPRKILLGGDSLNQSTTIDQLPQIVSWPKDGGAFITLPQVLSIDPDKPGIMNSNLGMYRIQLSGNEYEINKEVGLHYQLHRGIGVHHSRYNQLDKPFRVSVFVGGPPSHAFAAIMPLPEGLSELTFAGMLGGRRFRYRKKNGYILSTDADFVITGIIEKKEKKPEGPFGDHLGYYSLEHPFPVMKVDRVYHRKNPLWHFTVVGRPPAEDSSFGWLIHQLVEELTPQEFPGLRELNAVDAAGVHPLLLAIGSERYMPFRDKRPEEILTIANHILGSGQTSLAKYLWIADGSDHPDLSTHNIRYFFQHMLSRIQLNRDLHFQTKTTIDTLDYSGSGWNQGSKVVFACCGPAVRKLSSDLPRDFDLGPNFRDPVFFDKGILCISGPKFSEAERAKTELKDLKEYLQKLNSDEVPLVVLCDDSKFTASNTDNFVWVTFTRSNPSHDIHALEEHFENKHWTAKGPLIIDARIKPHHAPELLTDPAVEKEVDRFFTGKGPLAGIE
nr:UbiD family decarboxylase [Saprospiraceae bacterium]